MNVANEYRLLAVALCGVLITIGWPVASAQTPAVFKELGDAYEGRWLVDVTWAVDYPGLGKKGEKVTGVNIGRWILDGKVFEMEWFAGKNTGKGIIWWDPVSMQIKEVFVDSSGRWSEGTVRKKGGAFIATAKGAFIDGRKVEYEVKVTFQDGGRTRVHEGATIVDGKRNPFRDVMKRVDE